MSGIGPITSGALPQPFRSGTAFPTVPVTNDHFYRTDLALLFFWNGTRWLTSTLYKLQPARSSVFLTTTGSAMLVGVPYLSGCSDIWLVDWIETLLIDGGTALSTSVRWDGTLYKYPVSAGPSVLANVSINSGAVSAYRRLVTSLNVLLGATTFFTIEEAWTKVNTPGNFYPQTEITYRLVG